MYIKHSIIILFAFACVHGQLSIEFLPNLSPPASIPADSDKIYSVPLNQRIGQPVEAYIANNSVRIETGDLASAEWTVETVDDDVHTGASAVDQWKDNGGQLCQWASNSRYPNRMDRRFASVRCGSTYGNTTLGPLTAFNGHIIAEAMNHVHSDDTVIPANPRRFKFTVFLPDGSTITKVSETFVITTPAKTLSIAQQPPSTITANTPFVVSAEIHDSQGGIVNSGLDSTAYVDLQVSYEFKLFYHAAGKDMNLYESQVRMDSSEAITHAQTGDRIIRKRAVSGVVLFNDVRILDEFTNLRFNLTLTMARDPWIRTPDVYTDLASKYLIPVDGQGDMFTVNTSYPTDPSVVLSNYFTVTAQSASNLAMITTNADIKTTIGANFPIIADIVVEIQDSFSRRIYSGPDANLTVTPVATPGSACLSSDAVFTCSDGRGVFKGSICEPIASVSLTFTATSTGGASLSTSATPTLTVTDSPIVKMERFVGPADDIHIANYIYISPSRSKVGPNIESFARFAVMDINNGVFAGILNNRTLHITGYDTENDVTTAASLYRKMVTHGKENPNEMVRAIVGFGEDSMTEKLTPVLNGDQMPLLSTRDSKSEFGDKALYPYYNRLSWNERAVIHSTMLAAKTRKWSHIAIIRGSSVSINSLIYEEAALNGVVIVGEIIVPSIPSADWVRDDLKEVMTKLKNLGTRIIFSYITAPLIYHVLREAHVNGMSCMYGYQWVMPGIYMWYFPYMNQDAECQIDPICTVAYKGLRGFSQTYSVAGYDTPDWIRVMGHHIYSDRSNYKGLGLYMHSGSGAEMALAYDAVRAVATAMSTLIDNQETLTGERIALQIRQVQFEGLTGMIKFDSNGNRPGFQGASAHVNPHPPELGASSAHVGIVTHYIDMEDEQSEEQVEILYQATWPFYLPPYSFLLPPMDIPATSFVNKYYYNSSSGFYGRESEQIVPIPPSTDPPIPNVRSDYAVAPFHCFNGCGGGDPPLSEEDITKFINGNCTSMRICTCVEGYYGNDCGKMVCSCKNGHCESPSVCICDAGWIGAECDVASCESPCSSHGACVAPNRCECSAGYIGPTCGTHMAVVIILPLIFGVGLIVGGLFLLRFITKRNARLAALQNLDWLVKWDEVSGEKRAMSMVSTATSIMGGDKTAKTVMWKHQKCFCQEFKVDTLDVNEEAMRLEMVLLKETRHNNIITFVGACLEAPNVSLLTEYTPKGSLEDLLANESVKLGWDFRFSILKDICRGMDFLHRSEIHTHGRLKSTNCLVDNRWTCKIAGFGAPTMRYKAPRVGVEEDDLPTISSLFWTAPELLENCKNIDDVGSGTKAGDVYSFAILVTEVCTREQPYTFELQLMEPQHILRMIIDKDDSKNEVARTLWKELKVDTLGIFRPHIDDSFLPDDYEAKKNMRKLLKDGWNSDSDLRPNFKEMLLALNEIHPVKGELIDNLVNMLEKYSTNLEAIVAERTKELVVEKAKTEQLISQMLPKQVVEDLKHGRKVEPESFECVTIFFSDIVGFTSIARNSTPLQVVDLLNDLYTTFDAILDNYDVYKVETIGDAYMVVSGLPIRNGDLHAGEIATMSLDLLSSMCGFKIRHMPEEMLQLRVGMHSGPAVAGVVGLKMPRYCLFGDTVNTASRMESSSMALRIHMSSKTAEILMRLPGGYQLDCRGEREVKGKGVMTTYWLKGKDTFTKPLPDMDMAASESKHEFK